MTYGDLDSLLTYLHSKGSSYTRYREIVRTHFNNDETSNDVQALLIKLEKDGYADTANYHNDNDPEGWTRQTSYKLSFEGILFVGDGSYTGAINRRNIDISATRQRTIDLDAQSQRMERNEVQLVTWTRNLAERTRELTNWTRAVAIGAIGLVVWEIIRFFLEHRR